MQLSSIASTLFSSLALTPTVSSLALQQVRQVNLELPLNLCALNLESINNHIIDAVCAGPFRGAEIQVVNSKLSLDKCLTNSFGHLKFSESGGFHTTCHKCKLDGARLDFSCTCDNGDGIGILSDINLGEFPFLSPTSQENAVSPDQSGSDSGSF